MENFTTKQKGDVAEYRVIAELLRRGFSVLSPCGDRLPYDLALDIDGRLVKIQVKLAWHYEKCNSYIVDVRRSQTNRKIYKKTKYCESDFDFLIAYIPDGDVFYIFPADFACSFAGGITMTEGEQRQRRPKSADYREAWWIIK